MRRAIPSCGVFLTLCLTAAAPGAAALAASSPQSTPEPAAPTSLVASANAAARVQPSGGDYLNAAQVYAYEPGALFQVYGAPGHVTDIALQPGERLSPQGPVAAGDTVRWIIGQAESGMGESRRTHVLIKPTRNELKTNLVINTDRRTYHLELNATGGAYMAAVSWRYPQDELAALSLEAERRAERDAEPRMSLDDLNFHYRISGARTPWRPLRAFDDGRQTVLEFDQAIDRSILPPLFLRNADGVAELVNYRVLGRRLIIDRLFEVAELRLVTGRRSQTVVVENRNIGR
jgi:P-type conjugative transfer protein TrbG